MQHESAHAAEAARKRSRSEQICKTCFHFVAKHEFSYFWFLEEQLRLDVQKRAAATVMY